MCVELAYGLERLAMRVQNVDSVYDLIWDQDLTYGQVRQQLEYENTTEIEFMNRTYLLNMFEQHASLHSVLLDKNLPLAAYIMCAK